MCEIGLTRFYDGMADEVVEPWKQADEWYRTVAEDDPHLLAMFEHLRIVHGMGELSANLSYMFRQHRAAEIKGEFEV